MKPFLCGSEFPCNTIDGHVVILKDLAEMLNNTNTHTGVCKEEEFEGCKGGVEMACFVFGVS